MQHVFDHEKLRVYKTSLDFLSWLHVIVEKIPKKLAVYVQLDRASTSIPLRIAEGNGKYTERDRCKFFDIARGSTLECAAPLDVLIAKGMLTAEEVQHGKGLPLEIVSM